MNKHGKKWIFGLGLAAECAAYQLGIENVAGFCANKEYVSRERILGLPVVPYEEINEPKDGDVEFFVATGYSNLNRNRAKVLSELRQDGRQLCSLIPSYALAALTSSGLNCFLMNGCTIQPFVSIRDNVFLWSGSTVCHHCELGSNIWVTAGATVAGNTKVGDNVFIGANATIASGIRIGSNVFIGAGTLVVKDVPDGSIILAKGDQILVGQAEMFVKFLERNGAY